MRNPLVVCQTLANEKRVSRTAVDGKNANARKFVTINNAESARQNKITAISPAPWPNAFKSSCPGNLFKASIPAHPKLRAKRKSA